MKPLLWGFKGQTSPEVLQVLLSVDLKRVLGHERVVDHLFGLALTTSGLGTSLLATIGISEVWCDELELANFELRLDKEIASLSDDLGAGKYRPKPIRPLPYPKRNSDGNLEARQFF
jgi:hypothetical protein